MLGSCGLGCGLARQTDRPRIDIYISPSHYLSAWGPQTCRQALYSSAKITHASQFLLIVLHRCRRGAPSHDRQDVRPLSSHLARGSLLHRCAAFVVLAQEWKPICTGQCSRIDRCYPQRSYRTASVKTQGIDCAKRCVFLNR